MTPPPYDEEVDTILDNFGFSIANNREESRAALKRKPKAQLQALLLRAQIAEAHRHQTDCACKECDDYINSRKTALLQQLKEVERKDK